MAAATLALGLLAAACGGDSPGGATSAPSGDTSADTGEPVTLTMWVFEGEEDFLPVLTEAYREEHPHVTLQITEFPEAEYVTKIDTAIAAGEPPDIAYVYEPRWMKDGVFMPLDDAIAEAGIDLSTYNEGSLTTMCRHEDQLFCIGSYQGAVLLFYNKDMFDAAGVDYPAADAAMTIDEYAELAEALAVPADDPTQTVWGGSAPGAYWWVDQRTLFNEEGTQTEGYVNDEATAHTFDVLGALVAGGYSPGPGFLTSIGAGNDTPDLFAQGLEAMVFTDNFNIELFESGGINYGVAPVPVEAGTEAWVSSWTDAWGVTTGSQNQAAALDFVLFVGGPAGNELRASVGGLPLDRSVADETGWDEGIAGRQELLQAVALSRPGIFVPGFWDVTAPLEDVLAIMVDEGRSAQEVLDGFAPDMQRTLDEAWETWDAAGN